MPLIECPACGRQISVEAEACTQCGHPNRSAWPFTIIAAVIHTLLALVLFLSLIFWMPRFEKIVKDFNMTLPSSTLWVMAVSRWLRSYWYVVIFPVGLLFAGNFLILYLLRTKPGSRRLGLYWYWFFAGTLLLLLAGGTVAVAVYLPLAKLGEGLSK
jgi:type II secretory pathway component PulF